MINQGTRMTEEIKLLKEEVKNIKEKFRIKNIVLDLRLVAYKDYIAELEHDRKILKEEIERLRKL